MPATDNLEIGTIDDILAATSVIRESIEIIGKRGHVYGPDVDELFTILYAAKRIQRYALAQRARVSVTRQRKETAMPYICSECDGRGCPVCQPPTPPKGK